MGSCGKNEIVQCNVLCFLRVVCWREIQRSNGKAFFIKSDGFFSFLHLYCMCELISERNFESMPTLNYNQHWLPMFEKNHQWTYDCCQRTNVTRNTQHIGNLCLIYSVIHCSHWSNIHYMFTTIPLNYEPETDPKVVLDPL